MPYPNNYIGVSISPETHNRLSNLKEKYNENTFDDVVTHLLDLEEKYNPLTEVIEYEYMLKNHSKLFRITFGDTIIIEYYNKKTFQFERNIEAWFEGKRITDKELDSFIKFIIKDSNILLLYEIEKEIVQNGIWIKKVM